MSTLHPTLLRALDEIPECLRPCLVREAVRLAAHTRAAGRDFDDLMSEALMHARKALDSFDPARGIPLDRYVALVLRRRFIELGRRGRLVSGVDQQGSPPAMRERRTDETCSLQRDVHDVIARLLPTDPRRAMKREAFRLYHLGGYKLRELASLYCVAISTAHNWITDAEEDFKRLWK